VFPGQDAVYRIRNAEDRRDISVIGGGEEATLPLPRHAETASARDAETGKEEINNAVQGRRRGHMRGGGGETVRARRDVDVCRDPHATW